MKKSTGGCLGVVLGLAIIGGCSAVVASTSDDDSPSPKVSVTEPAQKGADTPAEENTPAEKEKEEPDFTVSQENAIRSAESYLDLSGFSREGLIDQLSSDYGDGYSKADATFAVDHVNADWNAEAVEAGESYLEVGGFSRAGLIDQLSSQYGDKFTKEQATYAADKLGL